MSGLAPATLRSYATGQSRYRRICQRLSILLLPTSERTLCLFAAALTEQQLTHKTTKCYLSAVRRLDNQYGHEHPFSSAFPKLTSVLHGVRRTLGEGHTRQRLSITPMRLRAIKTVWSQQPCSYDTVMLWADCCTGFFGFLRAGEFTVSSLSVFGCASYFTPRDIMTYSHEKPTLVRLHLEQSKTDPFSRSADVYLGRSANDFCPVSSLLADTAVRGNRLGPRFIFSDSCPLSRVRLMQKVQWALSSARLDCSRFTSHSFRIGTATTANARGIDKLCY